MMAMDDDPILLATVACAVVGALVFGCIGWAFGAPWIVKIPLGIVGFCIGPLAAYYAVFLYMAKHQ